MKIREYLNRLKQYWEKHDCGVITVYYEFNNYNTDNKYTLKEKKTTKQIFKNKINC